MSVTASLDIGDNIVLSPPVVPVGLCTIEVKCKGRPLRILEEQSVRRCSYWHDNSFHPAREVNGSTLRIRIVTTGYTEVQVGLADQQCVDASGGSKGRYEGSNGLWIKSKNCPRPDGEYAILVSGDESTSRLLRPHVGPPATIIVGVCALFILCISGVHLFD